MGAKIITEKDFWMCTSGAMPAQLQGTRTSNKKSSGEVYITVADTATSSWIDFGCTKNMLFAALIAAVVAVVVVALIVGTGGIAAIGLLGMMAIGAGAGIIGGTIAAVQGALKCGQKNATQRQWSDSKKNLILTGTPAITGAHTMTCKIGGTVSFAPEVKSWLHAISLGGLNYLTRFAECALGGAAVGGGGYLFAGLASGSIALAAPTVGSVVSNVTTGFTGVWGASRTLFGLNNVANEHAYGRVQNGTDALLAAGNGAVPEVGMANRILTGNAEPTDYMLFLYLLNVKAGRNAPQNQKPATNGDKDGNATNKEEGNTNKTPEDDGAQPPKGEGEPSTNNNSGGKKGDAFEDGTAPVNKEIQQGFDDLAAQRMKRNLPEAGTAADDATMAKLKIDGEEFYGVNRKYQDPKTDVTLKANAQTKTHAEADVVQQAIDKGKKGTAREAEMWTDRDACDACGKYNGIGSLARELGVGKITVHSPSGTSVYYPPKSKSLGEK
jgi:hypothetical protein